MPIRTNRGRAAVYRRLWGWPVRSPKHLAGTLVVFVALVVAAGIGLPKVFGSGGDGAPEAARPAGATSDRTGAPGDRDGQPGGAGDAGATSPLPTRLTAPQETPTSTEPDPAALDVAEAWARAWVQHPEGITSEEWLAGLRPYTTAEYLPVMSSVDPANVPSSEVTGEATASSAFSRSVEAVVPTDGAELSITVVKTDSGWRVAHYERAR